MFYVVSKTVSVIYMTDNPLDTAPVCRKLTSSRFETETTISHFKVAEREALHML